MNRDYLDDDYLVGGALGRRFLAWCADMILIGILVSCLWFVLGMFGLLTFGIGFRSMSVLPFVPFLYNYLSLISSAAATPGQQIFGLTVRRDTDLGEPTPIEALVWVAVYYLTLAASGLLLVIALFTRRNRALHDLLSGLTVMRADAVFALTGPGRGGTIGLLHDL